MKVDVPLEYKRERVDFLEKFTETAKRDKTGRSYPVKVVGYS